MLQAGYDMSFVLFSRYSEHYKPSWGWDQSEQRRSYPYAPTWHTTSR